MKEERSELKKLTESIGNKQRVRNTFLQDNIKTSTQNNIKT